MQDLIGYTPYEIIDSNFWFLFLQEIWEFCVKIFCQRDIGKHPVKLVSEFKSTSLFQTVYHGFLQVHGMRLLMYKTFAQISRIKLLEDILVIKVFKDCYGIVQLVINFVLGYAFLWLFQKVITIFGQL